MEDLVTKLPLTCPYCKGPVQIFEEYGSYVIYCGSMGKDGCGATWHEDGNPFDLPRVTTSTP